MSAKTTTKSSSSQPYVQSGRQEVAKHWFTRHLLKPVPWQPKVNEEKVEMTGQMSLKRPRTAPSAATATTTMPPVPPLSTDMNRLSSDMHKPPVRPPRPDSGVIRDVNAWLDTSTSKPAASPLMGGVAYWKEGPFISVGGPVDVQYALPIVCEPGDERPSTSHGQQFKSFCRRAKRMQVRMPSLRRIGSQRDTVQKKVNRRSTSTPLLAIPYEETKEGSMPWFLKRYGSVSRPSSRPATATTSMQTAPYGGSLRLGQGSLTELPAHRGSPASGRFGEQEYTMERRINAVFGQPSIRDNHLRPMTATASMPREDSMASLSDAPTYFSGPPPPSYRSRAASILTTSSFGCIDGMNMQQRQLSQQRAAQRKGMKGKLKKMAQRALLTK